VIVDADGRLFGKINLLDAAVAVVVLLLIPLAVVSHRVFRTPAPAVTSIEPATQDWKPTDARLTLHGEHLRPYLTVFVSKSGDPFSVDNRVPTDKLTRFVNVTPTLIELRLPDIAPGTYDLYLFDESRLLLHRAAAFTLATPAAKASLSIVMRAVVAPELAALIHAGDEDHFTSQYVTAGMANATVTAVTTRPDAASHLEIYPSRDGRMYLGGAEAGRSLDVTLRVPATGNADGHWLYKGQRLVPGDGMTFETPRYVLRGTILSLTTMTAPGSETRGQ
jgi:hypothetical protein